MERSQTRCNHLVEARPRGGVAFLGETVARVILNPFVLGEPFHWRKREHGQLY